MAFHTLALASTYRAHVHRHGWQRRQCLSHQWSSHSWDSTFSVLAPQARIATRALQHNCLQALHHRAPQRREARLHVRARRRALVAATLRHVLDAQPLRVWLHSIAAHVAPQMGVRIPQAPANAVGLLGLHHRGKGVPIKLLVRLDRVRAQRAVARRPACRERGLGLCPANGIAGSDSQRHTELVSDSNIRKAGTQDLAPRAKVGRCVRRCTHTSGSSSTGGSASTGGFLSWEQHTKLGIDISIRKVETQGAVQNAECSGRTVGFFFAEGLGLPLGLAASQTCRRPRALSRSPAPQSGRRVADEDRFRDTIQDAIVFGSRFRGRYDSTGREERGETGGAHTYGFS